MSRIRYQHLLSLILFLLMGVSAAHPLGEFVTNRYSRLELYPDRIDIFYAVDMAEIPSFQERPGIDQNQDGELSQQELDQYLPRKFDVIEENLMLELNQQKLELTWHDPTLELIDSDGLNTMRLTALFSATLPSPQEMWQAEYRDDNFADKEGWQEIVVSATSEVNLLDSSVPSEDLSQALTAYPADTTPPATSRASFQFELASAHQLDGGELVTDSAGANNVLSGRFVTSIVFVVIAVLVVVVLYVTYRR